MVNNNNKGKINYFLPGTNEEANKRVIDEITKQMHNELKDVFEE